MKNNARFTLLIELNNNNNNNNIVNLNLNNFKYFKTMLVFVCVNTSFLNKLSRVMDCPSPLKAPLRC